MTPQETAELDRLLALETEPVDFVTWAAENFYIYDTQQALELFPHQLKALDYAFEKNEDGSYKYETILWSWPKKSAKSTVIAAVADWLADNHDNSQIALIGNDLKQADSRVGFYLRESIRIAQRKGERGEIKIKPSNYLIEYPNGSRVEMLPVDPTGEAGGNHDLIVLSELWGWRQKKHLQMWEEMTISPNKAGKAQQWIDTYAGFKGESVILEQLYESVVKDEYRVSDEYEFYANENAGIFATWVTKPSFPWQTADYYRKQATKLTPAAYDRLHRNQWVSSSNAFIEPLWWDNLEADLPAYGATGKEYIVIGIDAAVTADCFAIVGVSKRDDDIYVRFAKVWTPEPGEPVDFEDVAAYMRRVVEMFDVIMVYYDRTEMHLLAKQLMRELEITFREFSQFGARLTADKALYDRIVTGSIYHSGEWSDLNDHIKNADADIDKHESKLRIVKRAADKKIDAAVALSMAAFGAGELNIG